jgi:hypothetical protein
MIIIHNCLNVFEYKLTPNGSKTSELVAEIVRTLSGLNKYDKQIFE